MTVAPAMTVKWTVICGTRSIAVFGVSGTTAMAIRRVMTATLWIFEV